MGLRENLYQALRDEEALRKSYWHYARQAVNNPGLREMFEDFARHQEEHIREIQDIIRRYFPRKP